MSPTTAQHDTVTFGAGRWTSDQLFEHFTLIYDQLQAQIDRRLETQLREAHVETVRIQQALDSLRRESDIRFDANERAISKAEAASEKRFEGVNEFRKTLTDQATLFAQREAVNTQMSEVSKRIDGNTARLDRLAGEAEGGSDSRKKQNANTAVTISAVSAAVTVLGVLVVVTNFITAH